MIHDLITGRLVEVLTACLIDEVEEDDPTRVGVVMRGPLQGDPDPDQARIAVEIYESDPDNFHSGAVTSLTGPWNDEIEETEMGGDHGGATWNRRFTIKVRLLFVSTKEDLDTARLIASTVRSRIEKAILTANWSGVATSDEYVERGAVKDTMRSEAMQSGGPPDSYDYFVKIRFDVQTTMTL